MNKSIKYASITASIVVAVLAVGIVTTVGLAASAVAQSNATMGGGNATMGGGNATMGGGNATMGGGNATMGGSSNMTQ